MLATYQPVSRPSTRSIQISSQGIKTHNTGVSTWSEGGIRGQKHLAVGAGSSNRDQQHDTHGHKVTASIQEDPTTSSPQTDTMRLWIVDISWSNGHVHTEAGRPVRVLEETPTNRGLAAHSSQRREPAKVGLDGRHISMHLRRCTFSMARSAMEVLVSHERMRTAEGISYHLPGHYGSQAKASVDRRDCLGKTSHLGHPTYEKLPWGARNTNVRGLPGPVVLSATSRCCHLGMYGPASPL
jgi:hypothetical protein